MVVQEEYEQVAVDGSLKGSNLGFQLDADVGTQLKHDVETAISDPNKLCKKMET